MLRLSLVALAALCVCTHAANLAVLSGPQQPFAHCAEAGPLPLAETSSVLAHILGVQPVFEELSWSGLSAPSANLVLQRPPAAALVVLPYAQYVATSAPIAAIPLNAVPADATSAVQTLLTSTIGGDMSLASIVSETFAGSAQTLAISTDPLFVSAAGSRDVSAAGQDHALTWDAKTRSFQDSDSEHSLSVTADEIAATLNASPFGKAVVCTKEGCTATLAGGEQAEFSFKDSETFKLFSELSAMLLAASSLPENAGNAPTTMTFIVASRPSFSGDSRQGQALANVVLPAFMAQLTVRLQKTFGPRVLVAAAALQGTGVDAINSPPPRKTGRDPGIIMAERLLSRGSLENGLPRKRMAQSAWRFRRAQEAATGYGEDSNSNSTNSDGSKFVLTQHCNKSMCYCFRSSNGSLWVHETGCEKGCVCGDDQPCTFPDTGNLCECVWDPCDCEKRADDVLPGTGICTKCDDGYVLSQGYCYVDNDFSAMVAIWIFIGVLVIGGLLISCVAIGGMDPGTNSVIYRMTSQRVKTQ